MRNLPVVLTTLNRPDYFSAWSLQQSHITHNNPLSNAATLTLGRIVSHLINSQDMDACQQEAERLISQYGEFAYSPYSGKASGYIVDTVQTVLHYFFSTDSFESCLIATVNQGGDADTTGALAGMLAGAKYGAQQIPERWLKQLDQQIVTQIRQQATELIRLAEMLENPLGILIG
jgi:ADP-ribosyl-[dinitrogen reductase] hydrolase